jgi:predicted DNA-binding protein YlxM (UPF0122 family)
MYTKVIKLNEEKFRRKTGVKKHTFEVMVQVVRESEQTRKKLSGRPNKLSYEDQVLMTLEYLREYRTYFSIGEIYEVSEANAYKIIKRTEDILIQADEFKLPSRKEMYEDLDIQVVVVDASESAIERPKKTRNIGTLARKRSTPLKSR